MKSEKFEDLMSFDFLVKTWILIFFKLNFFYYMNFVPSMKNLEFL